MEAIKNGLRKNLTPAQLWSGARFFLLLNLGLIIYAVALNFYCAPNHFVFGGTEIVAMILHKYIKVEIGRALLLSDIGTVLFAACIYGPQTGMYCVLGLIGRSTIAWTPANPAP